MRKNPTFLYIAMLLLAGSFTSTGQTFQFKRKWIDSVYNSMNERERIGQLFMVAAYSGGPNANQQKIEQLLKAKQIGGLIFMQGTAEAQAKLTNKYQKMSNLPLMIGMDAEWGLGMRLTGVKNFPKQMMLGATKDTALMYEMATAIATQCKRLGVHIDFAPVVDVNNNPKNPVINFRSFGEDKELVSRMGIAYMKGLQNLGVMASAKHFPGHGDVSVDSHKDLPVITKSKQQLNELEFYPFKKLINAGIQSVMIAHLSVPALDDTKNLPTTLSKKVVTDVLKTEMGFKGLVFTDALDMKGLTKFYPDGETDLMAFLAGNDVLLFSQNVPLAISKIEWAIKTNKATEAYLEERVKKVLAAKYDLGLYKVSNIKEANVTDDLNKQVNELREKISRAAVTLVKDQAGMISKLKAGKGKFAYINVNGTGEGQLQSQLKKTFPSLMVQNFGKKSTAAVAKKMANSFNDYTTVVVGVHDLALYPGKDGNYGLDAAQITLLQQLSSKKNVIFAIMGNAYMAKTVCGARGIVVGYEDDIYSEEAVFEVLLGKLKAKGTLPVKACK